MAAFRLATMMKAMEAMQAMQARITKTFTLADGTEVRTSAHSGEMAIGLTAPDSTHEHMEVLKYGIAPTEIKQVHDDIVDALRDAQNMLDALAIIKARTGFEYDGFTYWSDDNDNWVVTEDDPNNDDYPADDQVEEDDEDDTWDDIVDDRQ